MLIYALWRILARSRRNDLDCESDTVLVSNLQHILSIILRLEVKNSFKRRHSGDKTDYEDKINLGAVESYGK